MLEQLPSFFVVCLIAVPLLSAVVVALLGPRRADAVRWVSFGSTILSLFLSVAISWGFAAERLAGDGKAVKHFEPRFEAKVDLLQLEKPSTDPKAPPPAAIRFHVGIDGLNIWLVLLTSLLMVCSILSSWQSIHDRVHEYFAWMLVLQMAMVGVFLSFDIILFYVFFELTLVPLFFLIGIWGGPQRQYAARKFFIFTLAGSLITLLGVLGAILVFSSVGYSVPDKTKDSGLREEPGKLTFSIPELVELTPKIMRHARASDEVLADRERQRDRAPTKAEREELDKKVSATERVIRGTKFWQRVQFWIFLAMMVGFAVKVPLFPVHTWLPLAHTEAPTAGSVLLAGVLLKIGTYGFLRLCIPLTPDASVNFGAPFLGWLAIIGIIYGAFCALQQEDIKKMIAYSSVSHLGFCILGMFALNEVGITGSLLQMVNHGLSTGALFLLVGMLYDRYHTRMFADYGGMGARLKLLAAAFMFITMTSVGLPGLNGFVGEVLVLLGAYGSEVTTINGPLLASLAALGVILGAWYMLTLLLRVFFGELKEPHHEGHAISDLNGREIALLVPIVLACLAIGLFPQPLIKTAEPEIKYVAELAKDAREGYKEKSRTTPESDLEISRRESSSPLRGGEQTVAEQRATFPRSGSKVDTK